MSRDGLSFLVGAAVVLGFAWTGNAAPPDEGKLANLLAVQRAFQEGRDHLQRGNYQAAVFVLESQVARIDGNREYLNSLRDAYRGHIRDLQQNNRAAETVTYLRRLEILDPGTALDRPTGSSHAPAATPGLVPAAEPKPAGALPASLAVLAQSGGPKTAVARGVPEEVVKRGESSLPDPFHGSNAKFSQEARTILDKAELEFSGRHYDVAGKMFERANELDPALAAAARERWAYCKVFGVVDLLNRSAVTDQNSREAEQEITRAMSMSPKLQPFGKELLKKIQDRASSPGSLAEAAAVEVHHTPARGQGWALAETANFRIFHRQSPESAERVARIAESTKTTMARKWFGDDGGTWSPRCDLFLHATGQEYAKATGVPAGSPGHSTIRTEGERLLSRRIDLHTDDANMSIGVLPHETTHVVLAGRFGSYAVPRWADEGMAVLSEPRDRIDRHLHNIPKHSREKQLFGVGQLMRLNEYPDPKYIGPFYAQSVSLVDFLSREKGPRAFAQFLRDGLKNGYEPALERHYGIQGFHELEARWQQFALGDREGAAAMAGRNP